MLIMRLLMHWCTEDSDVKAVVASLNFIIFNSAKYNVNGDTVAKELQQLGLPKEHSEAVSKVYLSKKDVLREVLRGQTLKRKSRDLSAASL
jgi:hypothetical protein